MKQDTDAFKALLLREFLLEPGLAQEFQAARVLSWVGGKLARPLAEVVAAKFGIPPESVELAVRAITGERFTALPVRSIADILATFKTVKVWDAATGQETLTLKDHTNVVISVAFGPDGQRLAAAGTDGTVRVWDTATGQETLTLKGHNGRVLSVAFSPDGRRLASAGGDKTVKVWEAAFPQ
jgi:WD40 repeat protein